jgi:hypothetical protein
LLQHRGDLLDRETLLHGTPPGPLGRLCRRVTLGMA